MEKFKQLEHIKCIKALAETGLVYAKERYEELKEIRFKSLTSVSNTPLQVFQDFFLPEKDCPTVKVDVRGFVLNENDEILMVKEDVDGRWTIPGGWADIGDSPSEAILKEIKEETGLDARVESLLAIYYKRCHPHPSQPFYLQIDVSL